jgi:hypothetical protein
MDRTPNVSARAETELRQLLVRCIDDRLQPVAAVDPVVRLTVTVPVDDADAWTSWLEFDLVAGAGEVLGGRFVRNEFGDAAIIELSQLEADTLAAVLDVGYLATGTA